jgi:hypothetical protein
MKLICGDSFRDKAGIVLDNVYKGIDGELDLPEQLKGQFNHNDIIFYENSQGDPNIVFCRTDLLPMLVREVNLEGKTLITHNSDINVRVEHLVKVKAAKWFSQNADCDPVIPIPLGLENKRFDKWKMFEELRSEPYTKNTHIYLNVHPASNPQQRYACIQKGTELGLVNDFQLSTNNYKADTERYLRRLRDSYFVLCPEGAGIDTHRAFEALYMGAIPVVTESKLTIKLSQYFPLVILKSWDDLTPELLTEDFYQEMWDLPGMRDNLDFDIYWNKIIV